MKLLDTARSGLSSLWATLMPSAAPQAGEKGDRLAIYTRAADDVRAAIRAKAGADDAVPREQRQSPPEMRETTPG